MLVNGLTVFFGLYNAPFPQTWEENEGASYSLNVAYLAPWVGGSSGAGSQEAGAGSLLQEAIPQNQYFTLVKYCVIYVIKYFTTFFPSKLFFLFSSSKT